jgi:hypothetical protein
VSNLFCEIYLIMAAKIIVRRREYNDDSDVNTVRIHSTLCGIFKENFNEKIQDF